MLRCKTHTYHSRRHTQSHDLTLILILILTLTPIEATPEDLASPACRNIPNSDRKTFCGMARSADRAISNLTATLNEAFPGEDVLVVMSGDNGGEVPPNLNPDPHPNLLTLTLTLTLILTLIGGFRCREQLPRREKILFKGRESYFMGRRYPKQRPGMLKHHARQGSEGNGLW